MLRVIRHGKKRRVECEECGSVIEYEKEDVKEVRTHINEYGYEIYCPVCGKNIRVPHTP